MTFPITPSDGFRESDDLVGRVRIAIQAALSALEKARARRISAQLSNLVSHVNDHASHEPWYDRRWRLLDGMLEIAMTTSLAPMGHIHLREPRSGSLVLRAHRGFRARALEHFEHLEPGGTPHGIVLRTGRHVMIADVAQDSPHVSPDFRRDLELAGARALIIAPLFAEGEDVGTITVFFSTPCCATPDVCLSLDDLGRQSGALVQHEPLPSSDAVSRAS